MTLPEIKVRWRVSLSNGETHTEDVSFKWLPKEPSPWIKLQEYVRINSLKITSLCLFYKDIIHNLPSSGNNPKFITFLTSQKPTQYLVCRKIRMEMGDVTDLFTVAIAKYKENEIQLWVSEKNPKNSWILFI